MMGLNAHDEGIAVPVSQPAGLRGALAGLVHPARRSRAGCSRTQTTAQRTRAAARRPRAQGRGRSGGPRPAGGRGLLRRSGPAHVHGLGGAFEGRRPGADRRALPVRGLAAGFVPGFAGDDSRHVDAARRVLRSPLARRARIRAPTTRSRGSAGSAPERWRLTSAPRCPWPRRPPRAAGSA